MRWPFSKKQTEPAPDYLEIATLVVKDRKYTGIRYGDAESTIIKAAAAAFAAPNLRAALGVLERVIGEGELPPLFYWDGTERGL